MSRRSTPQQKIDDRAFPVRLFVLTPELGFGRLMDGQPHSVFDWLDREVGRGQYAVHGGGQMVVKDGIRDQVAVYFREPAAAARFVEAFPTLELGDGTTASTYYSPSNPKGRN